MPANPFDSVDQYIKSFPDEIQTRLEEMRKILKEILPDAEEAISYNMPAVKVNDKVVVYYAGYKNHIGFYPFPSGIEEYKRVAEGYETSKGTIQFPHDKPLPKDIIEKITKFRLEEVLKDSKSY